jgi:hypothetical protein
VNAERANADSLLLEKDRKIAFSEEQIASLTAQRNAALLRNGEDSQALATLRNSLAKQSLALSKSNSRKKYYFVAGLATSGLTYYAISR